MRIKKKPKHIKIEEGIYFITSHTLSFEPIFKEKKLIQVFLDSLVEVQKILSFSIYAYVILSNHFHIVLKIPPQGDLSKIMFRIKGFSSREINKARSVMGKSVWQDRYHDHMIRDEKDLENHFDYIHYNPVKHGLVNKPENWQWSSYKELIKKGYYEIGWGYCEPDVITKINYETKYIPG